ncbi:bromodomain adjacent to zinc finger domain protein 2B isoform X3 [Kryptolebias marmoratus]|uniref:bromodomain adjacent to zinc finger domain protein 2B isoform X3 n=1 Tax=Kryptolebias marmoratus TaxID=37003 RepID=UPI000D52F211|nr:bromodomain adjacent to zinc finger domain protein 2B isoform X3 [Kryptolebias marmoratus]
MESRKQLASPSLEKVSSSTSSFPAPPQTLPIKYNPASSPEGSSPLIICGDPLQMTVDKHSNLCGGPAFGLYSSNSSHSEFGGLGSLGLSTLADSQDGKFQEWWQPVGTNTKGSAAFFPPFLCLHPVFLSAFKSLDPVDLQSHASVCVGVNGRRTSPPTMNSMNTSSFPAEEKKDKYKPKLSQSQKTIRESLQSHQKINPKTKKRLKLIKSSSEISSTSGCLSGSWSESSSDTEETSSDSDDLEDDDNDPNVDDSDPEKESPLKRKRLTHTSENKKKRPHAADGNTTQESLCHRVPATSSFQPRSLSHQSTALCFQRAPVTQEEGQQHISVIQPTGLAAGNSSLTQACPSSYKSSPDPCSSKHNPALTSAKHLAFLSSPNQSSSCLKPLALCSPKNPTSLCSLPNKPPHTSSKPVSHSSLASHVLSASVESSRELNFVLPSNKRTHPANSIKEGCRNFPHESVLQPNKPLHLKDSVKRAASAQLKNQSDTDLFLNLRLNGATHSAVQDAPLSLVTKRRSQSSSPSSESLFAATRPSYLMPINLSTGTKEVSNGSASSPKLSAPLGPVPGSGKTTVVPHERRGLTKPDSRCPPVDSTRNNESEFSSSKGSDESFEDDEDDSEDEDFGSSLSDSESNLESDSSEDHIKERVETEAASDADKTLLKPPEASVSTLKSSSLNCSPNCSLLNQKITEPLVLSCKCLLNPIINTESLNKQDPPSSSVTFKSTPGRKRSVTDERALQLPLKFGWQRETRIRTVAGRLQGEVAYFAPCGRRLRQFPDIMKYLIRNGITEISRENFSFSTKIKVGNFYEVREGPEGLQWFLLAEDEITSSIIAMDGRRRHSRKSEHQSTPEGPGVRYPHPVGENNLQDVNDAKLMRKLKAQEIARQAAQIKLMRKLEKQALAQAAKEAKKQQAILAAEERRKKREEMKVFKQQEKIRRIQHIRMEKELRAQQVLEERRKKKEAAVNAKILEAEKRTKEKEIRRLQAAMLKQQELERHRLEMEKERRRQHMLLMKAVEAQKKAEEKERLKQEKKDKIRLNKEKKLALRRMELEKAKELRKPKEDLCLANHKPLPELSCMPGLVLPGNTISDCLMVLQFLHNFGKVLRLDFNSEMLTISSLQEGLLNMGDSGHNVQDMLVSMLSAAVCDPGVPAGRKCKTVFGDHLTNVKINRDNVSEILQIYMESHSEETELAPLAVSLKTKAFQAHSPSQKAAMLAFLVNELCCSKAVISEIDEKIDYMTSLRKDKWIVEGKLRKLRDNHARSVDKRDNGVGSENNYNFTCSSFRNKCNRKQGDSEEEEEYENDDSEDQGQDNDYDEEEEEPGGKKRKKPEICEEEDEGVHSDSVEELEKVRYKLHSQIRQELFDSSHSLRSTVIGEDRYKRRYWVLPQCGGIFVEGHEEVEKEEGREMAPQGLRVTEEQQEQEARKPEVFIPVQTSDCDQIKPQWPQNKDNLFPEKLGFLSNLSDLLEVAKLIQDLDINSQSIPSTEVPTSESHPSYPTSQTDKMNTLKSNELSSTFLKKCNGMTYSPQAILHYNRLSKILAEKHSEWFSLLPRSPCDESSVTFSSSSSASSSSSKPIWIKPSSFVFPEPPASANHSTTAGINSRQLSVPQQVKSGIHQSRQTLFSAATSSSLPPSDMSLPPVLELPLQQAEGNENRDLCLAQNSSVNKSKTTDPLMKTTLPCASSPAVKLATTQDYSHPQPIPEEMLRGWWRVSDMEKLQSLLKTLHCRGIRERVLQKQIQKHIEHMSQLFSRNKDELDTAEPEMCELRKKRVESWCVEEQAMEVDINLLRQVETLEKKVISANLQVKGWMPHEPQSNSEHLVYYEHKQFASSAFENKSPRETNQKEPSVSLMRQPNNPLDIAVTRFAELEKNIERSSKQEVTPGIKLWRKALSQVCSSAQLWLCIQQLQKTITWTRAIMKVHCQLCQKGDDEELLLLCNGCDKGCHTYCHNPKITTVLEGDWFCSFCVAKENGQLPHSRKQQSRTAVGGRRSGEGNRNGKPSVAGELISEEVASSNNVPKRGTKELKKRRDVSSDAKHDSPAKRARTSKDSSSELAVCRVLLAELEAHQDAWPFLTPVNYKSVPGYKKVIKKPMDFSTIREKLINNLYLNLESFIIDVNLVFDNCEKFNEDDSEIGRAGHSMRKFFDKRWTELLQ